MTIDGYATMSGMAGITRVRRKHGADTVCSLRAAPSCERQETMREMAYTALHVYAAAMPLAMRGPARLLHATHMQGRAAMGCKHAAKRAAMRNGGMQLQRGCYVALRDAHRDSAASRDSGMAGQQKAGRM